jgi:hypothetical protein
MSSAIACLEPQLTSLTFIEDKLYELKAKSLQGYEVKNHERVRSIVLISALDLENLLSVDIEAKKHPSIGPR